MEPRQQSSFWRALSWLPNLFILAILAGVGYWGHHSHWKLPRFSEIVEPQGAVSGDAPNSDGQLRPAADTPDGMTRRESGALPMIEFSSAEAARKCGIATGIAESRQMNDYIVASGVVDYDQTHVAQLSARAAGIVWRVEKRVGDVVHRGDVLEIVDSAEIGRAKANLLETTVVYRLKTITLERLRAIQSSVPARELRETEAAWELARVDRFNALQALVNLGLPVNQQEIDRMPTEQLADRLHFLGLPPALIGTLDPETTSANLIPLVAPFDGVVVDCNVVRGEMVEPAKPQYVLADNSRMWINFDIRQEDAGRARLGADVLFNIKGEGRDTVGKLTWIGTEIDPRTRTVQARTEVENPIIDKSHSEIAPLRLLQANAYGTGYIAVRSRPQAVVVATDAVNWQWELGCHVVFIPHEDGRHFEPRFVRTGLVKDGYTEILAGLSAGDVLVTSGSRILLSELAQRLHATVGDNADAAREYGTPTPAAASDTATD